MTFPIVTEITPRPEPVSHDPFIDGLGASGHAASGLNSTGHVARIAAAYAGGSQLAQTRA